MTAKENLVNELSSYLQQINFIETDEFITDLEDKYREFKA
jgi:hypothetical protein